MTRDQLEQKLWLTLRVLGRDRDPAARNIVANLLDAADSYATHTAGITADRRAIIDVGPRTKARDRRAP